MNSILKRTSLAIKSEATIELSYYKKADMTKSAVAIVKAKNKDGKSTQLFL